MRNQAALKAALRRLLEEKNYPEITVSEIASQAGLSRSTFYAYYENKDECLKALFQEAFAYAASHYPVVFENVRSLEELNNIATPDYFDKLQENATIFLTAFSVFTFQVLTFLCIPVIQDNFFILQPDFLLFKADEAVLRAFRFTYAHFCLSFIYSLLTPASDHALSKDQFLSLNRLWFYIMAKFGGYCPAQSPPNGQAPPPSHS